MSNSTGRTYADVFPYGYEVKYKHSICFESGHDHAKGGLHVSHILVKSLSQSHKNVFQSAESPHMSTQHHKLSGELVSANALTSISGLNSNDRKLGNHTKEVKLSEHDKSF